LGSADLIPDKSSKTSFQKTHNIPKQEPQDKKALCKSHLLIKFEQGKERKECSNFNN